MSRIKSKLFLCSNTKSVLVILTICLFSLVQFVYGEIRDMEMDVDVTEDDPDSSKKAIEDFDEDSFGGVDPTNFGQTIVTEYFKFNIGVINSLANGDDNGEENISNEMERSLISSNSKSNSHANSTEEGNSSSEEDDDENDPSLYEGSSAGSSFGLGQLLATVRELREQLPTSTPGFQNLLKDAPDYLTDMYQLVIAATKDSDFWIDTKIFTSEKITNVSFLDPLNTHVISTDFTSGAKNPLEGIAENVLQINEEVRAQVNKSKVNWPESNYIPLQMTLPTSTKAMLIHTLILSQEWDIQWKPVGEKYFQDFGLVPMLELTGKFPYLESDRATEVSIPLKNDTTRVLSLILPRNIQDALNGNLGEAQNGTAQLVRIQIPAFNFTFRVPHDGGIGGSNCNFEKQDNFMNVLDDLTFVKFSAERLTAIAVTGLQINNAAEYKQELKSFENNIPAKNNTSSSKKYVLDPDSLTMEKPSASTAPEAKSNGGETKSKDEKLIVFDRPFTWTIIDDNLFSIPVFSGAMETFVSSVDLTKNELFKNRTNVFGLDQMLRYIDCL